MTGNNYPTVLLESCLSWGETVFFTPEREADIRRGLGYTCNSRCKIWEYDEIVDDGARYKYEGIWVEDGKTRTFTSHVVLRPHKLGDYEVVRWM